MISMNSYCARWIIFCHLHLRFCCIVYWIGWQHWKCVAMATTSKNEKVGPSWSWSYTSWMYNYLCNQCLSSLTLWVRIPLNRSVLSNWIPQPWDRVCLLTISEQLPEIMTSLGVIRASDNFYIYCVFNISDFFIFADCTLHSSRIAWSCSSWWVLKDDM